MRIVGNIPHPTFKISIFATEHHFSLLFQAGPMEQSYKIAKEKVNGIEGLKQLVDQEFCDKIHDTFNTMFTQLKETEERYKNSNK